MANPLTGGYEGVVQISLRQLNAVLGTIHQNGALPNPVLKLLHSVAMRIGDSRRTLPDVGSFGDWLTEFQRTGSGRGLADIRAELSAGAPPGAAKVLSDALTRFDQNWEVSLPPNVVRGLAKFQVSSATITIPGNSSTEVAVHANVRAHYYPDPDTTVLPTPVHGDLVIAFNIQRLKTHSGARLVIRPSTDDAKIQFTAAPGSGLGAADTSRISAEIRRVIRQDLTQTPVDLPSDFPFAEFKGLGSGASQVLALPFQLSGAAAAGGPQSLSQSFIGSSGFALAVSKEYVSGLIDIAAINESLRQHSLTFKFRRFGVSVSVTYRLRFSSGPTLTFNNGALQIAGRVEAETNTWWAPNGYVGFKQALALVLNPTSQSVKLERLVDPDVDESWFIPHGTALNVVKNEIDKAIADNQTNVGGTFSGGRNSLLRGVRKFDPSATVTFTAVEITPNGVIVRGEIGSAARRAPIVQVGETHQGSAFTAFASWIPAGRINRFVWSWVEHRSPAASIFSGIQKTFANEHKFIMPKPAGLTQISQVCLRIEGTQIAPDGREVGVVAGTTCQVLQPEFEIDLPSWWEPLTVPVWRPDLADTAPLKDGIAGHISLQPAVPERQSLPRNTLVYFADTNSEKPLSALNAAVDRPRKGSPPFIIVVLPKASFESARRNFEHKFAWQGRGDGVPIQFTADDEGGWTRTFAVTKTPSVFLVSAQRKFVWKQEGELDSEALASALDRHVVPPRSAVFRPLELAVAHGDLAPDLSFQDDLGDEFALHRFHGQPMLLNFWQSWSAPCLTELTRLQQLHQADKGKSFIAAFHGGKDGKAPAEVRKRLGLSFPLIQDSEHQFARRYGVRCWPTTITVDADGRLQHIQLGTQHDHGAPPGREQPKPAETP
jgi:peroxiredoxin